MSRREKRYDILFEQVKIGPLTSKNRFFQVPHCNGMGHLRPKSLAAMRGIKAEGGWSVVCTEETYIHASSENDPLVEGRLWDEVDMNVLKLTTEEIHKHGSLAGIELHHGGHVSTNYFSRIPPFSASNISVGPRAPIQARAMNKSDIRDFRKWHRTAALRAMQAGFDLIYVYAAHSGTLLTDFLLSRFNNRSDEYGGSLENRIRLLREIIEDTKDAVGHKCAIALRFAVEEFLGPKGITFENEGKEIVEILSELPDIWDVNISDWSKDSATSRFASEGYQEEYIKFVKSITSKPVVGVGRFTSPDTMVSMIRRGIMDFIGAARPSIADPFLPKKIEEGKIDEIRECIGCNICVVGDELSVPIRCTQNPTMGEEWRRGWHPEFIEFKRSKERVLIVGAGPAGLEFALTLAKRGFRVILTESSNEVGGRVIRESCLPGLSEWIRVKDYRINLLKNMEEVTIYCKNKISSDDIIEFSDINEFNFSHVIFATGAIWRRDGFGRNNQKIIPGLNPQNVYTPDDIMDGISINGKVVIFDDDHFYMGGVIAEKLVREGNEVMLVTPAPDVSTFTHKTLEQRHIQKKLIDLGVKLETSKNILRVHDNRIELSCVYSKNITETQYESLVLVTERFQNDELFKLVLVDQENLSRSRIKTLRSIGDSFVPGTIAAAVYSAHLAAREFNTKSKEEVSFLRERIKV